MTDLGRFDRFDRGFGDALDRLATPSYPDYFDDALERAVARRQRPTWTFPERWLPMTVVARTPLVAPPLPWRTISLLAVLALLAVVALAIAVGSQRAAPPYGLASNGLVAYSVDGDIRTRDLATGVERMLVSGPDEDFAPLFSRDGTHLAFLRATGAGTTAMVARADGQGARAVFGPAAIQWGAWSPSGDELALLADLGRKIAVVDVRGEGSVREIDLPAVPLDVVEWRPPDGRELVFRAVERGRFVIATVGADGTGYRALTPPGTNDDYWAPYTLSPDGKFLAYTSGVDGIEIRILDLEAGKDRAFNALPPPAPGWDGVVHSGSPVFSPDGSHIAFGRYWDERDGQINHQLFVASATGDGSDAVAIGPLHRSRAGHNPFAYVFSPDGGNVLIQMNDVSETWLARPEGGRPQRLQWGDLLEPPDWQRMP